MTKYLTIYQENASGEIEKIEMIDGVVVNEGFENADSAWESVHSAFRATKKKPYNDNGREFNSVTGNWEYTPEANGDAPPCQCNYEAPQDYQGSVPVWDGYTGEG